MSTDPSARSNIARTIRPDQVPSLGVVEGVLADEAASYRDRANGLDSKAGVVLSSAGVIVALVGIHSSIAGLVGQFFSITAGVAAVWTLMPRVDKAIGPRQLRDKYLQQNEVATRLRLLNTRIDEHESNERSLLVKAFRLRLSASLLLGSAIAVGIGGILNDIWH